MWVSVQLLGEQMATQNVNIGVNVSDNGTAKKVVKNFQEIEAAAVSAQKATEKIQAGTASSRKLAGAAPLSSGMSGQDYGAARGSMGSTGAAGRDFANQAQGLGGLVRLYATWAANIFAVSAAYTMLDNAATKTRMIEASELVSKRVGVSMKILAKDIQEATSYAVSFEEALQFGNLGVSAGIAADQMKNLVMIAKGAANVLGRDVGDSVRRIVQGTAKQEQEILDELGIFVKAKDAYEKYAKDFQIKGGADALSAQEKVIAYANAVEQAGSKWKEFAKVEDPFSQFAAKGKEAIFSILEAVNTIFVPILKFITQSSEGIIGLALLIGLRLTKQALPELGKAFQEALSFDKYAKEAKFQKAFDNLSNEFKKSNTKLTELKAEQVKILTDVFDPKVAAFTKFTDQMGGSMRRVASGVFGTEAKPIDINKYKDVESVNTAIEKSLLAQVKGAKDKEATLQKIVGLGLADKTSTLEKITLDEKGRTIGAQMYQLILQRQAGLTKELAIQASINALQEKSAGLKLQIDEASLNSGAASLNRLSAGSGIFAKTMSTVNSGWAGFKIGLGTSSILAEKFALAMQGGTIGLTGFLRTLPAVAANVMTAGAGLGFLAATAATTGAVFAGLAATVSAAMSAFLGPLLLAYTAWQLFGDSIMGLIPGYKEAKLREEELQKSLERGVEGAKAYMGAMSLITKEREAGINSFAQYLSLLDREEKITLQRISALSEEIKKVEEAAAVREAFAKLGSEEPSKNGEIDTQSPEYIKMQWDVRRKIVQNGTNEEKLAIDNIINGYDRLARAQKDASFFNSNVAEISRASLALNKLELDYLNVKRAAYKLDQELSAPWVALESAAKEAGSALEKAAQKDLKFPAIDAIKEVSLNNYAGKFAIQLRDVQGNSALTERELLGLVQSLEDADKQAKKAGSTTAIFAIILEQLKAAGSNQEQLKKLPELFSDIAKNADKFYTVLANSTANKDAVNKSRKTVDLLKTEEDNKIKMFDKTAQQELEILKRTGDLSLKLIELRRTGRDISEGKALGERLTAVQNAEAQELKLIEDNAEKRQQLVTDRITAEYKTYQKNLKLAGKDTELTKKATDSYTKAVNDLMDAQELYSNLQEKRKGEIKDGAFVREAEIVEGLKGKLFELKKAYKEAAEDRDRALGRAKGDFEFSKSKSMMGSREGVVAEATRESSLNYESQIREATKLYTIAQKDADDALLELGDASPVTEKLTAIANTQSANLRLLRAEAATTSQTLGTLAGQKFDFDNLNKYSEGWTKIIDSVDNLAASFTSTFGEIGTSVGSALKSLADFGAQTEQNKRNVEFYGEALIKAKEAGDVQGEVNATKALAKATTKQQRDEVSGIANIAGSSKKLFKEKTAAYKILDTVEKVAHVTRLAMDAKELAIKLGFMSATVAAKAGAETAETGLTFAGTMARLPAYAAEIYGKTIGQLGPIAGPVVATALVATMFSLFGKGGGSKGGFVPNAEQRQEVQGTAMGYDANGNKVQVRRGVFGDTDAKSESIANSLEILRETSVDGLSYDNQMVKLLESIDRGINKTAKSLYSIEGLRSGSMFGTVPGTQSGGGFLGTGVFASKTTRTISDSGILIEGTFADLAKDTNKAVIDFFEQVTVSKKSWYGKTKTWVETTRKEIDDATSGFFKEIFGNATLLLKEAGSKANIGADAIDTILGGMQLKDYFISLRGLKGEDFQKELSSIISSILDDASSAIFESFEKYAKFGEGMLETVNRVIDNNIKIDRALRNLGSSFDVTKSYQTVAETVIIPGLAGAITIVKMIGDTAFDISEALVENAGSLESFLSQAEFFRENFLTAAQQLAPITTAVNVELVRLSGLGFAAADGLVDTREEFRLLVQNLDLSTEAGRNAYQSLMNVQEGFIEMIDAAEQAAQKLKDSREDLFNQVLALTGTSAQILAASRAKQLSETAKELVPLQTYVYALEDVKAAEQALTKAREAELNKVKQQKSAIESTINSLKNYIDSFKKFKDSLLLGAASPLTPTEKYAEAKKQFDAILATATGVAATPEQERAKNAALGQLESSATAFLDASKTYNASSSKYIDDFNLVQRALTDSTSALSEQLTNEERSLAALDTQISLLEEQIAATNTLNNSILSVADAIAQLNTAKTNLSNVTTAGLDTASTSKNDVYRSSLGGFIIGNQLYGSKGNTGIVTGANGSTENTLKYMRMVEKGEATAKELRRIYVDDWGIDSGGMARITGMSQSDVLAWFKRQDPTLPTFASGTNFVPEDMIAQIHQGERIVPAADNAELMSSMGNRNRTNEVLVTEIKKLNQKIDSLEKAVAQGAVINAEATNRNTVEISRTVKDTGSTTSHNEAIRRRTQVV